MGQQRKQNALVAIGGHVQVGFGFVGVQVPGHEVHELAVVAGALLRVAHVENGFHIAPVKAIGPGEEQQGCQSGKGNGEPPGEESRALEGHT